MQIPLNASATPAGTLFSSHNFVVPPYQREYAWEQDDVSEFWHDLKKSINDESYFLGLVIITEDSGRKHVVDGQQRLLTLSLLAAALYHEAYNGGRKALAERLQADFLKSIDYETDECLPRVTLSDSHDNSTFQNIINNSLDATKIPAGNTVSELMKSAYTYLRSELKKDLSEDPFKRMGAWTDFITNKLYFAVFLHPDSSSAYRVFEVINTRGRELTTADLLKNYVISQTAKKDKDSRYKKWQKISHNFSSSSHNTFVQYIRHTVTMTDGYVLPRDLFDYIAKRGGQGSKSNLTTETLINLLEENLPLYLQMIDPSIDGPAEQEALKIFAALNELGIISVRPLLLSISKTENSLEGMRFILKLVVRRIISGNLGTGNVERRLSEAAKKVHITRSWEIIESDLFDLNPSKDDFINQLKKRSYNKSVLEFIRRSTISKDISPESKGHIHLIMPRYSSDWEGVSEEDANFWANTIGNTILLEEARRPKNTSDWTGAKQNLIPLALGEEWQSLILENEKWDATAIESTGKAIAEAAGNVWY